MAGKKISINDSNYRSQLLEEFKFKKEEELELIKGDFGKTGFPAPFKTYRLLWELYDLSIEETYYWVLDFIQENFSLVDKLEDSFAAAENSAFFGASQQRLGAQQDRVSQYLATMGKMVKELFQMVRELRILDERLTYYDKVEKELEKPMGERSKKDEVTLKGLFVDLVQGGGKSAGSIYGMAQQLEFITLPDLFFDAPPFKTDAEMVQHVKSLEKDFNDNLIRVLLRHLNNYTTWRQSTHKEHANRKTFMLKYLKQHYDIIQMYISWVKPYLRNVRKLSLKDRRMSTPELIAAFEGSMLDVEVLARKSLGPIKVGNEEVGEGFSCLLATFKFRTRAELKVQQEGYQRGPVHIGRMELELRSYKWTGEDVANYKKLKEKESMLLLGDVSNSVQEAMEALGDELFRYLKEATGETEEEKEQKEQKVGDKSKKSMMESLFGDFYTPQHKKIKQRRKKDVAKEIAEKALDDFRKGHPGHAAAIAGLTFINFKKSHRMLA